MIGVENQFKNWLSQICNGVENCINGDVCNNVYKYFYIWLVTFTANPYATCKFEITKLTYKSSILLVHHFC